jgi:hypothetical protein
MKLVLKDIYYSQESLGRLVSEKGLAIKTAYWLGKLAKKFSGEITEIEKRRQELVKKYGVEGENKEIRVPEDKMAEFRGEFEDLLNTEIDFDVKKFTLQELEGAKGLSAKDLMVISYLIEEEDNGDKNGKKKESK